MKNGKGKETTSATSCMCVNTGRLRSTPAPEAKYMEGRRVGSICCPNCNHELTAELLVDFFKKCVDQLGLLKFEPSDQKLIDHLEAKINKSGDLKPNPLIDEFIPTIEGEEGICYTHPAKLPGITKDGTSKHFFHKSSMAYKTGTRKRRRIQSSVQLNYCETRWHKTGKTKPVISNGILKGCKKILVLYNNYGNSRKPTKTNWIMHQYHLGAPEDETEGEFVLSKIFYQMQRRQPSEGKRDAVPDELFESGNNNEVRSEPRMMPEVCEAIGYMHMPPLMNTQETPAPVSPLPAFHLNAPNGPFTQVVTAPPMHEVSGCLGNNYQQNSLAQVSPFPAFHLNAPNGPFTQVFTAPPMHEASGCLDNNYQQNMPATSAFQIEQQQYHGNTLAASLEEILGYTSADPNEGTSNALSNEDWEFINWQTSYSSQNLPGAHG